MAAGEALPSLMRYTRPLSAHSETRLSPSFLRTTPARKPSTECCCHSVAAMIAAMVAPAGIRSIARMRACLVSGRDGALGDERSDRERGLDLRVFRAAGRVETLYLAFDLDFVMGSSEVMRRHPPHHLSPARAKPRQGKTPKRAFAASKSHSNAPIKPVSQSNLSKIVALLTVMACLRFLPVQGIVRLNTISQERR